MKNLGSTLDVVLIASSFILFTIALYLVFIWVPTATSGEGIAQKIFYFHVPIWWVAFLGYIITFIGSLSFLLKGSNRWDNLAFCAAEIGTVFVTIGLITGIIWAKPAWGLWWTWDPRLTTALVLWFVYIGYFLVRTYAPADRGRNFAAVISILGTINSFVVFMAIRWWRTQHPQPVLGTEGGMAPEMYITFSASLLCFTVFFVLLMRLRTSLRSFQHELARLQGSEDYN